MVAKRLRVAERLRRNLPVKIRDAVKTRISDLIDYEASNAVVLEHSMLFGAIYITRQEERRWTIKKIQYALDEASRRYGINFTLYLREELYKGSLLELLPDILIVADNYQTAIAQNFGYPLYKPEPLDKQYTGIHDREGVILVSGSEIKKVRGFRASIYDVMPTVLYIHNLPIPINVDGKPLTEIFAERREPRYVDQKFYTARLRLLKRLRKI
jgi:hypothetical protein